MTRNRLFLRDLKDLTHDELQEALQAGVDGAETELSIRTWCKANGKPRHCIPTVLTGVQGGRGGLRKKGRSQ